MTNVLVSSLRNGDRKEGGRHGIGGEETSRMADALFKR